MSFTPTQRLQAANLLILMEGLRLVAYQDGGGTWTIGIGSTFMPSGRRVTRGDTITRAEALALVEKQVDQWAVVIGQCITAPLPDPWLIVLISFVHQEGPHALPGSVMADMINAGFLDRAGRQLNGWVIASANGVRGPQRGIMRRMEAQRRIAIGSDMNAARAEVWLFEDSLLLPLYDAACADAAHYRNGVVTWEVHPPVHSGAANAPASSGPLQPEADALMDRYNSTTTGA